MQVGDLFAATLATGDFNSDGYDDLAVGMPGENGNRGFIHVMYSRGPTNFLDANVNDEFISQDSTDIGGAGEAGDLFGSALPSSSCLEFICPPDLDLDDVLDGTDNCLLIPKCRSVGF